MPKRSLSRSPRLLPLAAVLPATLATTLAVGLVSGLGCSTTPQLIGDIGDAVDRGAQKVVGVFDGRSLPPPQESEEEAVTEAREAYEAGKMAYQTAQYLDALEHFLESFAAAEEIEDDELKAQIQSSLYYNLGSTHLRAYDLDNDRAHLAQAKALLQSYLDSTPEPTEEEREQALSLMEQADQQLAGAGAGSEGEGEGEDEGEGAEPSG